jgi:hypothetical protein
VRILWPNVIALALLIFALVVVLRHGSSVSEFLGAMNGIGPGHDPSEQVMGLVAFGLILVSIVAVLKIVISTNRKE